MNLSKRIDLLVQLGKHLARKEDYLKAVIHQTEYNNKWFTKEAINQSIDAICIHFLDKEKLENWAASYHLDDTIPSQTVALVMAGNIPLVGFHDLLCVFLLGHRASIKLSEKDKFLIPYFIKWMTEQNEAVADYFSVSDKLGKFDAVIATGSNNSARYFEVYFGKYPNIIRKNRNSIAVLDGTETEAEIIELGQDIYNYFGLGCRNVSKLYVPKDYDFQFLLETLHENYKKIVLHSKYKNNFDYNYAIFMLNRIEYKSNGCIMLLEDKNILSRIATLHYEYYENKASIEAELAAKREEIQCLVSKESFETMPSTPYGQAQKPTLTDYPDGVDVVSFLLGIG